VDVTEGLAAANDALDARDAERALAELTRLLDSAPESAAVRWTAGRYFGLHKAYSEAASQFLLAVQRDPTLSHVEFAVGGKVVRLRDVAGSTWAANVLKEFSEGMYGLTELPFAPGDVALDIGAHIGGVSVVLATLHPDIRIISYEPASSNFAMLRANLGRNSLTNVTPVQQAVMGERGEMQITWTAHDTAAATVGLNESTRHEREQGGWQSETVECVTLDDVFATHAIDRCSWLKLDCEGAEWNIAATTGMLGRIDRIAMELHIPMSRREGGAEKAQREFAALARRVPNAPSVAIASTVWILDN
jgi:FkbM family methyltransferase